MKLVVFDLETGGVEPTRPNIQLAAAAIEILDADRVHLFEAIDLPIRFDPAECDPAALELNSYDPKRWEAEAVTEAVALQAFIDLCGRHKHETLISKAGRPYKVAALAGHNCASFDIPRLLDMAKRHGDPFLNCCWWYPLDTYQGSVWHFRRRKLEGPKDYKLATLARAFGLPAPTHDAYSDLRTTGYLLAKLLHG
jgi:DNA polymerase III epsilon subunit-like protein